MTNQYPHVKVILLRVLFFHYFAIDNLSQIEYYNNRKRTLVRDKRGELYMAGNEDKKKALDAAIAKLEKDFGNWHLYLPFTT